MKWVAVVMMLAPMVASADPASDLFDEGRALLEQGKAPEACAKFEASLKLDPEAGGVLLNLGLCNVQQHKVATALTWFRKAATFPEVAAPANQQVTTLASLVPTIRIDAPADAAVTIDGVAVTDRTRIEIDAGHHVAEVGGVAHPFDVSEDPSRTQLIVLQRPEAPVTSTVTVDLGAPRRHVAKILGGVGAGLVVATGIVGLVGRWRFDASHDLSTRQEWTGIVEWGGTGMFLSGCALLGTAAAVYFTAPGPEHRAITPLAAPGQVGLAVSGVF